MQLIETAIQRLNERKPAQSFQYKIYAFQTAFAVHLVRVKMRTKIMYRVLNLSE